MNRAARRRHTKCKHRNSRTKEFATYLEVHCEDCNTVWKKEKFGWGEEQEATP